MFFFISFFIIKCRSGVQTKQRRLDESFFKISGFLLCGQSSPLQCVVFQEQLLTTTLSLHHVFSLGQPGPPQEVRHSQAPRPDDPLQEGRRDQSWGGQLWLCCCCWGSSKFSCRYRGHQLTGMTMLQSIGRDKWLPNSNQKPEGFSIFTTKTPKNFPKSLNSDPLFAKDHFENYLCTM